MSFPFFWIYDKKSSEQSSSSSFSRKFLTPDRVPINIESKRSGKRGIYGYFTIDRNEVSRKGRKGTIRIINSLRGQLNRIENRWRESRRRRLASGYLLLAIKRLCSACLNYGQCIRFYYYYFDILFRLLELFLTRTRSWFRTSFVHCPFIFLFVYPSIIISMLRGSRCMEKSRRQLFLLFRFSSPLWSKAKQFYRFSIVSSNRGPRPSPSTKVVSKI